MGNDMQYLGLIVYAALVCAATAVLICRSGAMTPDTLPSVRLHTLLQLAGVVFGMATTLVAGPGYGGAVHVGGVLGALLVSSSRWRDGAPPGTAKEPM